MSAKPEAKAEGEAAPKKGKGKLLVLVAVALLVLGGGGGAAWYFLKPKPDHGEEEVAHAAPKKAVEKIFTNLDPFTVNLADEGGERMAQIAVVLELDAKPWEEKLTKNMPIVRNNILMLMSSLQSKEILTLAGKNRLAGEIANVTGKALGWELIEDEPEDEDEAEEEVAPPSKDKAKDAAKKPVKKKKKKKRVARRPEPNPVVAVHFGQFIVQ